MFVRVNFHVLSPVGVVGTREQLLQSRSTIIAIGQQNLNRIIDSLTQVRGRRIEIVAAFGGTIDAIESSGDFQTAGAQFEKRLVHDFSRGLVRSMGVWRIHQGAGLGFGIGDEGFIRESGLQVSMGSSGRRNKSVYTNIVSLNHWGILAMYNDTFSRLRPSRARV
jgi:hypothetical protein